jgi:leucyl aminopeptidase
MPVELLTRKAKGSLPIHFVRADKVSELPAGWARWAEANGFGGEAGQFLVVPGERETIAAALLGTGKDDAEALAAGALAKKLPDGAWHFADATAEPTLTAIGIALGGYTFTRYRKAGKRDIRIALPAGADAPRAMRTVSAATLVRDLINTPASDMGPSDLEKAARALAKKHSAKVSVIKGDDLLKQNFPMIHAVGRASADAPRLIDLRWGRAQAPKVTLVGKGVCFDTGGLDLKPSSSMLLMKKDMGGAANVLGLASMLMDAKADIRLRVLVPAVENSVAGNAFRPLDVLHSRKGITVEIGNTDAEGRLVLGDALTLADEEEPQLLIDMATLTGAARVALGPDLPPFFTDDETLATEVAAASVATEDPVWRLPLWKPYRQKLSSRVADTNNVTTDGFAGSVTAALFLQRFVEKAKSWAHFDIYGWNPVEKPWSPVGGEAQAIRALEKVILDRYGVRS